MFSAVDDIVIGGLLKLTPQFAQRMIREERRKGFESPPEEREAHFERANQIADSLGYYHLMRGFLSGR